MRWIDARESMNMAWTTLRTHKMRSALTMLGIMIGVTTVILISSFITGLNRNVDKIVQSMGANVYWVFRFPVFGNRPTQEMLARRQLSYEDAIALRVLPHVDAVDSYLEYRPKNADAGTFAVKAGDKKVQNTTIQGTTEDLPKTQQLELIDGRYFTQEEAERRANVVVLGPDTAEELFGTQPAVGREVEISGELFRVIGVLDKAKQVFGGGKNPDDNVADMPLLTFRKIHPEVLDNWITVKYDDARNKIAVEDEVREMLRKRRKVKADAPDNFAIFTPDGIMQLWNSLTGGLFIFLIAVSSVGLMVGGVGVMNIMLVSVTERTREIGIRKAIGATKRTILLQFTVEAIALCALGGMIGVSIGVALTYLSRLLLGAVLTPTVSLIWLSIGLLSSCGIGLMFGIYPAWKAASLDPIEALRYE